MTNQGVTETGSISFTLRETNITVIDQNLCVGADSATTFCAGETSPIKDSCYVYFDMIIIRFKY